MAASLGGWWKGLRAQRAVGRRWKFEVERALPGGRVAWRWSRYEDGTLAGGCSAEFPSFADCARDAGLHGFDHSEPYELAERDAVTRAAWARPVHASPGDEQPASPR